MSTLLVTDRMNPALAARVRASLQGPLQTRGSGPPRRSSPLLRAVLRVLAAAGVVGIALFVHASLRARELELENARAALSTAVSLARSQLDEQALALPSRLRRWLLATPSQDEQPRVNELPRAGGFQGVLARRALFVRGTWPGGFTDTVQLQRTAAESRKDAFLFCLFSETRALAQTNGYAAAPPSEHALSQNVDRVNRGDNAVSEATQTVYRLEDALTAEHYLAPAWSSPIAHLPSVEQVEVMQRAWERAHVKDKLAALQAEVLIYVLDEPKAPGTVVELDGASHHRMRVGIVDLVKDEVLLQLERTMDPDRVSDSRRSRFAFGIESCRIATEIAREFGPETKAR